MVIYHNVEGFDACINLLQDLESNSKVVLYFSGALNDKGENWCPDCEKAKPIVNEVLKKYEKKNFIFVNVSVGTQEQWKDPKCKFRTDERFKLTSIPTLMVYKSVERLNDIECQEKENVQMLIEEL